MSYVELHCYSNFSFLEGASHPEELVDRACELGYSSLALTDRNGFYGIVRFNTRARERGLTPIIGADVTLEDGSNLVLLVTSAVGYANLSQLLTSAQMQNSKGNARAAIEMIDKYREGLIALSGGPSGQAAKALADGDLKRAEESACRFRELFGADNFFLELCYHNLPWHEKLCESLARLGTAHNIPLVATNCVHYAVKTDRRLQDVLTCIKQLTTIDTAGELLYPNGERYLKKPSTMARRFAKWPSSIANTVAIAERCRFTLDRLSTSLPDFPVPEGMTVESYLCQLTYEGAKRRYGDLTAKVVAQIEHELRLITKLNLSGYFLIVWDIARFCVERGILSQGRGSAANSAVCYCLGITAVDSIRLELLFERFVSEERSEPPDIDIDIANNRREEVIQYVYERYGRQHAAMVCEIISYRGRSAIRDVGKALGFSLDEVDKLAKLIDHYSGTRDIEHRIREANLNLSGPRVALLVELCKRIKRFPRHLGIHVGGMIITKVPLSQLVPIEQATMPGRSVIQWDKDDVEEVRMVKIDLLGLGMLSLIDIALRLVKEHHGVVVDPARLTYDDPKVYDLMCAADTVGVFQIESRAQMNTLPRHQPRCFYDLVVEVALIRPGPIQGDMVHPYLRRRNGEEPVTYPHPSLEPILKRTLGIPLFQEQGMRVAMTAAGFTPSQADELRRAMGHKRSREKMEAVGVRLIAGMVANGITEEAAEKIFSQLAAFADFGFAESHAASFALLVYVSAWLKVYYPKEFYCSLLNSQPMGFYSSSTVVSEARRRGVRIMPVDIHKSEWDCTIEPEGVRLGFRQVKNLGDSAKEKITKALPLRPFTGIERFALASGCDEQELSSLAMIGAFAPFGVHRRDALWRTLGMKQKSHEQLPMGGEVSSRFDRMTLTERLVADFKGLDLTTGPHPMILYRPELKQRGILSAIDLRNVADKATVTVAGVVIIRQRPQTAKGFLFITLEDETGFANIVVKPNLVERNRKTVVFTNALIVLGVVERRDGVINVIGKSFAPLNTERAELHQRSRDFR